MPQRPIGAPVFRQFDRGAAEVAVVLLELGFEAGKEREGIRRRAGKTRKNLLVVQTPDFFSAMFDDRIA